MLKEFKNFFILIILSFILFFPKIYPFNLPDFQIIFFDVGEGDAIFIRTPENKKILIDGGANKKILYLLSKKLSFLETNLDLVILTHPHADHLNGLIEVINSYRVKKILLTGVEYESPNYKYFLELIKLKGIKTIFAKKGQKIPFKEGEIEVLYPFEVLVGKKFKDINQSSIVLKVKYKTITILLPGDIGIETEKKLVLNDINLKADILKIAHQGSATSTSELFLQKTNPLIGIISVGENTYGHPSFETLDRIKNHKIDLLRTDLNGTIELSCRKKCILKCRKGCNLS